MVLLLLTKLDAIPLQTLHEHMTYEVLLYNSDANQQVLNVGQ